MYSVAKMVSFHCQSLRQSGRAPVVEFSQKQTCWRLGRRPETRTLSWSGRVRSGLVWSGRPVRVRLVEFGL